MAKPDWGELQQRFLSEHAKTDISPKEWCEAQGLNYTSARRYIKKPAAQKEVRKTAESQMLHVVAVESASPPDSDTAQESAGILMPQHELFEQDKEYYIDIQPVE